LKKILTHQHVEGEDYFNEYSGNAEAVTLEAKSGAKKR